MPVTPDLGFLWIALPVIVWAGSGLNSLVVYFAGIGGRAPAWLGIWGVTCTVICAACITHGVRLDRAGKRTPVSDGSFSLELEPLEDGEA
jgi:hypothetical protein